ncbi:hypothetical protein EDC15_101262 [Acetobacter aceti NBRC 14818]|nr:hypothetical protein EDC15_101262 [Acetobacter aceti NBRC 14818]
MDILLNNAGISEGSSVLIIPADNLRWQYEVNQRQINSLTETHK